ncbi:hypothetical protein ACV566_05155 [Staphylococcus aureus]
MYYFLFDFAIRKFKLKTPGREDEETEIRNSSVAKLPFDVLDAIGKRKH